MTTPSFIYENTDWQKNLESKLDRIADRSDVPTVLLEAILYLADALSETRIELENLKDNFS